VAYLNKHKPVICYPILAVTNFLSSRPFPIHVVTQTSAVIWFPEPRACYKRDSGLPSGSVNQILHVPPAACGLLPAVHKVFREMPSQYAFTLKMVIVIFIETKRSFNIDVYYHSQNSEAARSNPTAKT
jgi:hypothetical protein